MRILYIVLDLILIGVYVRAFWKIKTASVGVTPLLGWMTGLGFFVLTAFTAIALNGGYHSPEAYEINGWGDVDLSNFAYLKPFLSVWLAFFLACVTACFFRPDRPAETRAPAALRGSLERAILITMGISLVSWIMMVYLVGGIAEFLVSHWYNRIVDLTAEHGASFLLFDHLSEINSLVFTAATALHMSLSLKIKNIRWGFTALIVLFFLTGMVMTGNRIFVALYGLAFLVSAWVFRRRAILVGVLALSPVAAVFFGTWAAVRHDLTALPTGLSNSLSDYSQDQGRMTPLIDAVEGTDITLLMHMVNDFGHRFPYLRGATYSRIFTFFLPRSVYPDRPVDFNTFAASLYEPGGETSLNSTVFGEGYANFGLVGLLVPSLLSWLICRFTEVLSKKGRSSLMSAMGFVMCLWLVRGAFAETAVLLLGCYVLVRLFRMEPVLPEPQTGDSRTLTLRVTPSPS